MRRNWRVGRVVLGVMLFGGAALLSWHWRPGPRWRMPGEDLLGFDRRLLLTTSNGFSATPCPTALDPDTGVLVHTYDLATGTLRFTTTLLPAPSGPDAFRYRGLALAPDARCLALWGDRERVVEVFSWPEGRRLHRLEFPAGSAGGPGLFAVGFSRDSRRLAANTSDRAAVIDLADGQQPRRALHSVSRALGERLR